MDLRSGWKIFFRALRTPGVSQIRTAAEWMYRLNIMARAMGNQHVITDVIYSMKDELIRHLYQCGYATEVRKHMQKRVCRACGGTRYYWTGEECHRCEGTGVYAYTELVAFRFCVDGHTYAWHQLKKLIDYEVIYTDDDAEPFREPLRRDDAILSLDEAWLGCCVVWWSLLFNGERVGLFLFDSTSYRFQSWFRDVLHLDDIKFAWRKLKKTFGKAKESASKPLPVDDIPF